MLPEIFRPIQKHLKSSMPTPPAKILALTGSIRLLLKNKARLSLQDIASLKARYFREGEREGGAGIGKNSRMKSMKSPRSSSYRSVEGWNSKVG